MGEMLSTWPEDQNQSHVPVSFWLKQKLFIFMKMMMTILNHLIQVQVGLASSQKDTIYITLK
jgi:hypothetical protein